MRRRLAFTALMIGAAAAAAAQDPTLTVTRADSVPRIETRSLLTDGRFTQLMQSGFPLRLHYRLELWRDRSNWFDQYIGDASWDAVAHYDPIAEDFILIRTGGTVSRYADADDLERALELPYRVSIGPKSPGRFYYVCRLEVSTLNDTDLAALERWLRGDVGPSVGGDAPGNVLTRGAQQMLVRIAGLPRVTVEARSATFPFQP